MPVAIAKRDGEPTEEELVRKAEREISKRRVHTLKAFLDSLNEAPSVNEKHGTLVWGKRVSKKMAKSLAQQAAECLTQHFSVFEVLRLIEKPEYSLERYLEVLKNIRDSENTRARDRMDAADKIMGTLMSLVKHYSGDKVVPEKIESSPQVVLNILANVRGEETKFVEGEVIEPAQLPDQTGV